MSCYKILSVIKIEEGMSWNMNIRIKKSFLEKRCSTINFFHWNKLKTQFFIEVRDFHRYLYRERGQYCVISTPKESELLTSSLFTNIQRSENSNSNFYNGICERSVRFRRKIFKREFSSRDQSLSLSCNDRIPWVKWGDNLYSPT